MMKLLENIITSAIQFHYNQLILQLAVILGPFQITCLKQKPMSIFSALLARKEKSSGLTKRMFLDSAHYCNVKENYKLRKETFF